MSTETKNTGPASVQEIWEKTITRFQQRTGQRLDGVSRTPDDLRRALDAHYAAQADDPDVSKAKAVGFRMIHCIQLLGGIAAQGASMVFGPAGLCFNALSFLLDIPKKVNEFHGEINAIFAEVGPALAQFRIYQRMEENTHVDEALRTAIDQVMTSFVDICANCINIHREGRWKSFKRNAKRVLLDEGSVRGELDNFKKLTQDQLNVQATLTLEVALDTNQGVAFIKTSVTEIDTTTKGIKTDVTGLVEAEHKRGLNDARKKNLDTIKEKLGQKEEDVANVVDARDNMWKNSVKGSGKWLNDVEEYRQWLDRSSAAEPLLILTGDSGTGKSFLVSAIAQDVKARNSATKAERALLGYYSFSIATKTDSDRNRPETAMKSICLQMADQDAVYAKHAAGVCGESGKDKNYFKDATCQTLWAKLGIGAPAKNAMHYILLDSVGLLSAEELERLLEALRQLPMTSDDEKSSPVRILISGEPSNFQEEWLTSVSAKCIDITQYNADDISAFIVEELKKADLFQEQDLDSQRRRKTVRERLLKRSNNCYATVHQDLGKIKSIVASSGTEDELNRVLQESSTDPKALVRSEIETLAAVLNPRELEEVNELLTWTVAGFGRFTLDELASALYMRFKSVSLQPLAQKITGKYSKLFTLTYGGKFLALRDYVEECVVAERVRPRQSVDDPKITATITVTNGDIKAVQRFFWDLTHHSSFANGFEFRPDSDLSQVTSRKIQIYKIDAHFEIVKRAFDYFLQPPSEEKEKGNLSGKYFMMCLPDHLKVLYEAEGLDELPLADKQYIGSHIYDMFNEGDLVESNWELTPWSIWYKSDDEMGVFWSWLDDPVAIARLGARDKRWLTEIKKGNNRNRSLLTPIMTMVARNWLQGNKWEVLRPIEWLTGFLTLGTKPRVENSDGDEKAATGEAEAQPEGKTEEDREIIINENDSVVDQVVKAEKWAKKALGVSEVDCTWCIRLGQTYRDLGESEAAVEQYQQAATILQGQEPIDKEQLASVFQALGELQDEAKNALPYYKQAYEQNDSNADILYALATHYAANGSLEEAASIVQKAVSTTDPDTESSLLIEMLQKSVRNYCWDDMVAMFAGFRWLITSSPECWTALQTALETAIEKARAEEKNQDIATFQLLLGSALYYVRQEFPEDLAKAVDYWNAACATVREEVGFEDQDELVYIEQYALSALGRLRVEQAIREENPDFESCMVELRKAYDTDRASQTVEALLANLYTLGGQRHKAREILRPRMVTAFNILADDDAANDWEGFASIRHLLVHTGDFENARKACMLLPMKWFSTVVLKALLEDEDPPLEAASAQLVKFFEKECLPDESQGDWFTKVLTEAERLLAAAEPGSNEAAVWTRVSKILDGFKHFNDISFWCNGCGRNFDFEIGFNVCKYCYNMDLCDNCLGALRDGKGNKPYICSQLHDWIPLEPWKTQSYVRGWKKLVPVVAEDGSEQLISASKWMGNLCEDWGLAKEDWDFE
ncbi:hypothetical protein BJX63DRAFT_422150 [Aspergillus granulosus]|uniref:Fungal STAND N-terminal Goodbye domain-containing protein n=1 Tax=Aspergillus granulosus TaxID=176169 RepID=A0ABR4H922_9EURO